MKRAAMMIKMNDMAVNDHVVIPVVARPIVTAVSNKLTCELSGWDTNTWDLANWFRESWSLRTFLPRLTRGAS